MIPAMPGAVRVALVLLVASGASVVGCASRTAQPVAPVPTFDSPFRALEYLTTTDSGSARRAIEEMSRRHCQNLGDEGALFGDLEECRFLQLFGMIRSFGFEPRPTERVLQACLPEHYDVEISAFDFISLSYCVQNEGTLFTPGLSGFSWDNVLGIARPSTEVAPELCREYSVARGGRSTWGERWNTACERAIMMAEAKWSNAILRSADLASDCSDRASHAEHGHIDYFMWLACTTNHLATNGWDDTLRELGLTR